MCDHAEQRFNKIKASKARTEWDRNQIYRNTFLHLIRLTVVSVALVKLWKRLRKHKKEGEKRWMK